MNNIPFECEPDVEELDGFDDMSTNLEVVFAGITEERLRQIAKWGDEHHSPEHYLTILMEEVGEVAKSILDKEPLQYYRNELIQVAAVAVRAIQTVDKIIGDQLDQLVEAHQVEATT